MWYAPTKLQAYSNLKAWGPNTFISKGHISITPDCWLDTPVGSQTGKLREGVGRRPVSSSPGAEAVSTSAL